MKRQETEAVKVPAWSAGAVSEKGLREENQDRMTRFQSPWGEVILVADGMGGMKGGATAAEMVARELPQTLARMAPSLAPEDALQQAVGAINRLIFERGHSNDASLANMGSTLVLALIREGTGGVEATVANIGDSRAYLMRNGALRLLSKDHTAVQRMVDAGAISSADARNHPEASVLTRALGQQPDVALEMYAPVRLQPGDGLLLCSDGLSGYVHDPAISQALAAHPEPNEAVRSLVDLALRSGSDDNITVQFVRISGPKVIAAQPPAPVSKWKIGGMIATAAVLAAAAVFGVMKWRHTPITVSDYHITNETGDSPKKHKTVASNKESNKESNKDKGKKTVPPNSAAESERAESPAPNLDPVGVPKVPVLLFTKMKKPPAWLAKVRDLSCLHFSEADESISHGEQFGAIKKRFLIIYRPSAAHLVNDCLLKAIPSEEVKSVELEAKDEAKFPPFADVLIVPPKHPTAAQESLPKTDDDAEQAKTDPSGQGNRDNHAAKDDVAGSSEDKASVTHWSLTIGKHSVEAEFIKSGKS